MTTIRNNGPLQPAQKQVAKPQDAKLQPRLGDVDAEALLGVQGARDVSVQSEQPTTEDPSLRETVTQFAAFVSAMDAKKPVVAAAGFLDTKLDLEGAPASIFSLFDGHISPQKLDVAMSKIEGGVFARMSSELSTTQQKALSTLRVAASKVFRESVPRASTRNVADALNEQLTSADIALAHGDLETVITLVLMGCSQDAADDLRQLFSQMQQTNNDKQAKRAQLTLEKKHAAQAEALLRSDYDARCALSAGDARKIWADVVTFDAYKLTQSVVLSEGELSLSPNGMLYPPKVSSDKMVLIAERLSVDPEQIQKLYGYFQEHLVDLCAPSPEMLDDTHFLSFEEWLISPRENGGVALTDDDSARAYLLRHAPDYLDTTLQAFWSAQLPEFRRAYANDFEAWALEPQPNGPGFVSGLSKAEIEARLAAVKTAASGENEVNTFGLEGVMAKFQLAASDVIAANRYFKVDPRGALTIDAFLLAAGCRPGGENRTTLKQRFTWLANPRNAPEVAEYEAKYGAGSSHVEAGANGMIQSLSAPRAVNPGTTGSATHAPSVAVASKPVVATAPAADAPVAPPAFVMSHVSKEAIEAALEALRTQADESLNVVSKRKTIPPLKRDPEATARLRAPRDTQIVQPPRVKVSGRELTAAQLSAELDGLQGQYDSLGALGQEQSIHLQMYQERRAEFTEALSNVMKKIADTSKDIIASFK